MAKIWDEEDDDYTSDYSITTAARQNLEDAMERATNKGFGPILANTVGICSTCASYSYAVNDMHQVVVSYCSSYGVLRRCKLLSCSRHKPKGQMSLDDMYEIATIIDIKKGEKKVEGFTGKFKSNINKVGFNTNTKQKEK